MILYMYEGKERKKKKKMYTTLLSHIVIFDIFMCNLRHGFQYSRSVNKRMTEKIVMK
jgi:hypothetical protein